MKFAMKNSQLLSPFIPLCVLACMLSSPALANGGIAADQSTPAQQPGARKPAQAITGLARTAKTSMGVRIRYTVDSPAVGGRSQVRLSVQRPFSGPPLTIELAPSGGLRLGSKLPGSCGANSAVRGLCAGLGAARRRAALHPCLPALRWHG